jgi:hypothetical protein
VVVVTDDQQFLYAACVGLVALLGLIEFLVSYELLGELLERKLSKTTACVWLLLAITIIILASIIYTVNN